MVVQGAKKNESVDLTTIWTVLGFPLCSIVVPTWVSGGEGIPSLLTANQTGNAPLCQMALDLKGKCFPIKRGSGKRYINLAALCNLNQSGIMQKLPMLENSIISRTGNSLAQWRSSGMKQREIEDLYEVVSEQIIKFYSENFDVGY